MIFRPRWVLLCASFFLAAGLAAAQEALFPFVVSYDTPDNATNLARWLAKPAGGQGFIRVEAGRLANDAGPLRFHGTNLCFDACFPAKEQAERLARRLARLGINVVRMHHMDAYSIWGGSPNKLTIDPERLDRLDYLIAQLKANGVYTNLNLHVSRTLGPKEGFPEPEKRPTYDKGVDNFEPRMIELQKKYARDLLTHVNPYTGKAYVEEPAVAFVEINNENALFDEWRQGSLDALPDPYATTFRRLWNAWLRAKYGSTEVLRQAWREGERPLGKELLANGDFSQPLTQFWSLERDDEQDADWTIESNAAGRRLLRLEVRRPGRVSWRPQFSHHGIPVKKGEAYTLTFAVRSDAPRALSVNCMMAHDPWEHLGLGAHVEAGLETRRVQLTFLAQQDDRNARITFTDLQPGVYELADVSLRPGGVKGLGVGERLEEDRVPVFSQSQGNRTPAARRDFIDFLWDTERDYWHGMYRYLKEELGVRAVVAGTQLSWSPVHVQAGLDLIDAHAYWQHPNFPGRAWDRENWYMRDVAMVNSPPGTLIGLAGRRVAGTPFTVSEYNHPAPNMYAAEGLPMLAAMAAFQGWDGIYSFAYSHHDEFEPRRVASFFDIQADPTRLVHMPACAALFLRGDVAPAQRLALAPLSRNAERERLYETGTPWSLTADQLGADRRLPLVHALGLDLSGDGEGGKTAALPRVPDGAPEYVSDHGALRWNVAQPAKGYFLVDAPRTKLFTGFVAGRSFALGEVMLRIGGTRRDWATVSLTCLDGDSFAAPGRILAAATGWRQSTGWDLKELGDDRVTLGADWGREPVLCEGVPATITLPVAPHRVTYYVLDEAGNRRRELTPAAAEGKSQITLSPEFETLWYEIVIK